MSKKKTPKPAKPEIQNIGPAAQNVTSAKIPSGVVKLRDKKQILAAQLLIDGGLTDEQIAKQSGCKRGTLARWKLKPEFIAYLDELKKTFAERFLKEGLAKRENRVAELSSLFLKSKQVIIERAEQAQKDNLPAEAQTSPAADYGSKPDDPKKQVISLKGVAGANTGMVVMTYKGLGNKLVAEVDTGTVKMMAAILDQISIEVGDKNLKSEVKINDAMGERMERAAARLKQRQEQRQQATLQSTALIN